MKYSTLKICLLITMLFIVLCIPVEARYNPFPRKPPNLQFFTHWWEKFKWVSPGTHGGKCIDGSFDLHGKHFEWNYCDIGLSCISDINTQKLVCCYENEQSCKGSCISCPATMKVDIDTCNCVCPGGHGGKLCGNTCKATEVDSENCGACGNKSPDSQICEYGQCICIIGSKCNEKCTDVNSDPYNCGKCGEICTGGWQHMREWLV